METIVTCRHGAGGASPPPSTGEAERGGSRVRGQLYLHSKTLLQKAKQNICECAVL